MHIHWTTYKQSSIYLGHNDFATNLSTGSSITSSTKFIICNIIGNGIRLGQKHTIRSFESRDFAQRKFLQECRSFICFSKHKILGYSHLSPTVFGSNQGFLSPEVVRISVKSTGHHVCSCYRKAPC